MSSRLILTSPMKKLLLLVAALVLPTLKVYAQTYTVTPSATSYLAAGGQMTFTVNLSYPANVAVASFSAKPPGASWVLLSTGGTNVPPLAENSTNTTDPADPGSKWGWAYGAIESGVPAGSASFTFTVQYPAGMTGNQTIAMSGDYRLNEVVTNVTVAAVMLNPTPTIPVIDTHPENRTVVAGLNATFTVAASGNPMPTLQWQRSTDGGANWANVENDASFSGVTTTTLTVNAVTLAMQGHRFRAAATNSLSTVHSNGNATLTVTQAPLFDRHPTSQSVATGGSVTFTVAASGSPTPTYQWRKGTTELTNGGRFSGATSVSLTISNLEASDAGANYNAVARNGISPDATSKNATLGLLPVGFGATHALVGNGYAPGGTVTVTTTITYSGEISSYGLTVLLPTGWRFVSDTSTAQSKPEVNDISVLDWNWTSIPANSLTFTYTLSVPSTATGSVTVTEMVTMGVGSGQVQFLAHPDPLTIPQVTFHSVDTSGNRQIEGSELNRLIQLFNTRFTTPDGKIRTGAYVIQADTIDGFAPDSSRDLGTPVTLARYHGADTSRNGQIEGSELNRVIQLFNTRFTTPDGKIRTGAYKLQSDTIDGFAPDPDLSLIHI